MISEKTVLILDDEILVAVDIGDELENRGWRVMNVVGTLEAARSAIDAKVPDLAILDMNLRGRNSFELARDLLSRGVAVVFLSGNTVRDLPEDLQECAFLGKPVNYDRLHETLLTAVGADV
jgi:DNA-binding response OmpR family regulator